tara:strand:- start:414 stop:761 length:348 start_codon:yes stop_codon:yes gene_type:complete
MSKQLLIEPADVNTPQGELSSDVSDIKLTIDTMPKKIVAHIPTGSWYTISREERWSFIWVAPIYDKTPFKLPLEDEWVQVSCLNDLSVKEYDGLRRMLNKEFPNDDIDDLMYRCL